jgi:hypothetical protein
MRDAKKTRQKDPDDDVLARDPTRRSKHRRGSSQHWVSAPPRPGGEPNVRVFGTTTPDLQELVDWLAAEGEDLREGFSTFASHTGPSADPPAPKVAAARPSSSTFTSHTGLSPDPPAPAICVPLPSATTGSAARGHVAVAQWRARRERRCGAAKIGKLVIG